MKTQKTLNEHLNSLNLYSFEAQETTITRSGKEDVKVILTGHHYEAYDRFYIQIGKGEANKVYSGNQKQLQELLLLDLPLDQLDDVIYKMIPTVQQQGTEIPAEAYKASLVPIKGFNNEGENEEDAVQTQGESLFAIGEDVQQALEKVFNSESLCKDIATKDLLGVPPLYVFNVVDDEGNIKKVSRMAGITIFSCDGVTGSLNPVQSIIHDYDDLIAGTGVSQLIFYKQNSKINKSLLIKRIMKSSKSAISLGLNFSAFMPSAPATNIIKQGDPAFKGGKPQPDLSIGFEQIKQHYELTIKARKEIETLFEVDRIIERQLGKK